MVRVTLRLPEELHRRLRERAERERTSLNQAIVDALEDGLVRGEPVWDESLPMAEKVRLVRAALGDLVVDFDVEEFPPNLRPGPDLPDHETLRRMLPKLDPPLSRTIIEEREESPY